MSRRPGPIPILLVAAALFLRLWLPAGWMPAANGSPFAIELCASAAPMPMATTHHDHGSPAQGHQHDGDCAFAPHHAGIAQLAIPQAQLATAMLLAPLPQPTLVAGFATGPPALPPPATGPPSLT